MKKDAFIMSGMQLENITKNINLKRELHLDAFRCGYRSDHLGLVCAFSYNESELQLQPRQIISSEV